MLREEKQSESIILIGMPVSGKSTIGVLLAQKLSRRFLDTDDLFQKREGLKLKEIMDSRGIEYFEKKEEAVLLSLVQRRQVIATGGSAVFYPKAMNHLKTLGSIVYLSIPFEKLEKRLWNLDTRGVVFRPGQDLRGLYEERLPLYEKYADFVIESDDSSRENMADQIIQNLKE